MAVLTSDGKRFFAAIAQDRFKKTLRVEELRNQCGYVAGDWPRTLKLLERISGDGIYRLSRQKRTMLIRIVGEWYRKGGSWTGDDLEMVVDELHGYVR